MISLMMVLQANQAVRALAARAVAKMIDKVRQKLSTLLDRNFVAAKDAFISSDERYGIHSSTPPQKNARKLMTDRCCIKLKL
jgi:hypothetical protein